MLTDRYRGRQAIGSEGLLCYIPRAVPAAEEPGATDGRGLVRRGSSGGSSGPRQAQATSEAAEPATYAVGSGLEMAHVLMLRNELVGYMHRNEVRGCVCVCACVCRDGYKRTHTHTDRHKLRTAKQEQGKKSGERKLLSSRRAALTVFRSEERAVRRCREQVNVLKPPAGSQ